MSGGLEEREDCEKKPGVLVPTLLFARGSELLLYSVTTILTRSVEHPWAFGLGLYYGVPYDSIVPGFA